MQSADNKTEWLKARKTGIGGSDVAAVLGLSPWRSPLDVWLDKTGRAEPQEENDAMYWGAKFEALVAQKYSEESGNEVRRVNSILRSKEYPMLIGNIDRAVCTEKGKLPVVKGEFRTPKILECKTAAVKSEAWGDEGTDEIPDYYLTQCLHYLGLTGCECCDVAVLFTGPRKFGIYTVMADSDVIGEMSARLADWWETYVAKDTPPPPRSAADVQRLFKRSVSKEITATAEIEALAYAYATTYRTFRQTEAQLDEAKEKLCVFMGEADTLVGVDGKPLCTWKSSEDSAKTDWEAVARAAGATEAQIAAHTTTRAGARRFLSKINL